MPGSALIRLDQVKRPWSYHYLNLCGYGLSAINVSLVQRVVKGVAKCLYDSAAWSNSVYTLNFLVFLASKLKHLESTVKCKSFLHLYMTFYIKTASLSFLPQFPLSVAMSVYGLSNSASLCGASTHALSLGVKYGESKLNMGSVVSYFGQPCGQEKKKGET